ncbi:MAG: hypothetical protein WC329_06685 [Candidatus Omnitrophota bacterium]|jgi:type IV pilus assembly protein PilB|nr:hypothetical protein [Candidatus Omnitrophota bacterium]MDD5527204.1 hypothetical protein [Candidatus Omnitrophota bacterium]NLE92178.1 hypothetical protein [Elusimicrobiota bacterium]
MTVRRIITKQLGELLLERGVISKPDLEKALNIQKERGENLIGEILVEMGVAKEEDIAQAITAQYGFPFLPLTNYEIAREIIKLVPDRVAKQYMIIPVDKIGDNLTVAMSNPLNIQAIEDVEMLTACHVQTFVSTSSDIKNAIEKYYSQ